MSDSEIKPAAFKRGVPKAARNGIYGMEQYLIEHPDERVVAVVVFEVEDVIEKQKKGEQYPVVQMLSIEPIVVDSDLAKVVAIARKATDARDGAEQLDIPEDGD